MRPWYCYPSCLEKSPNILWLIKNWSILRNHLSQTRYQSHSACLGCLGMTQHANFIALHFPGQIFRDLKCLAENSWLPLCTASNWKFLTAWLRDSPLLLAAGLIVSNLRHWLIFWPLGPQCGDDRDPHGASVTRQYQPSFKYQPVTLITGCQGEPMNAPDLLSLFCLFVSSAGE